MSCEHATICEDDFQDYALWPQAHCKHPSNLSVFDAWRLPTSALVRYFPEATVKLNALATAANGGDRSKGVGATSTPMVCFGGIT